MPIHIRALGEEVSIMRIGRRQLARRVSPKKRDKPTIVIKSKSVPSRTEYWLKAAIALAEAAMDMRGHPFEEVIDHVILKCKGKKYVPKDVLDARLEARYKEAEENVERMKEELEEIERRKRLAKTLEERLVY